MAGRTNCSQLQIPFCWCQLLKRRLSLNRFLQNFSSNFLSVAGFFYIFRFILPWDSFMWLNWIRFYQLVFFRDFKLPRRRLSPHRVTLDFSSSFLSVTWFLFCFPPGVDTQPTGKTKTTWRLSICLGKWSLVRKMFPQLVQSWRWALAWSWSRWLGDKGVVKIDVGANLYMKYVIS